MDLDFNSRITYWCAVDCANAFGYDKLSFEDRVAFVRNNYTDLPSMIDDADSAGEFIKALNALKSCETKTVPDHMVYLDASNQALQLYAVLTGDLKTAQTCNLANGLNMADAYQMLANALNAQLNLDIFTRSNCKSALMTTMYGKTKAYLTILDKLYPHVRSSYATFCINYPHLTQVEEDGSINSPSLANAFNQALLDIAPRAMSAMDAIQSLNDEDIGTYYWTMPDGFKVKYDVKTDLVVEATNVSLGGKSLKISAEVEVYEASRGNRGMAPNVIHSIDGYVARQLIRRMGSKFITTIHDAFAVHPAHADELRSNYADIMVELLDSDLLNNILSQIAGTDISMHHDNGLTAEHIRGSVYALS